MIEDEARSIFLAALEQPPDQWPAFLDDACRDRAELRARLDQLLRAHQAMGSIHNAGADAPGPTVDDPITERVGTLIGPYKLLQPLGEGGMGVVWVAEQTEPVKRRVALKVIKPGMDSAQVVRRFEQERQALALMDHSNIAKVFEAGTTETARPYFVMELVKGVPITKYCDELHLPIRERLELFVPVCQAIQHAHQKGIIHRDIKPSNVLVCMQDGKPVAKVIDFGVAKALHQRLTDESMYTEIGQIVGTLEYMSPEQAELSALDIDTRADVYALGVLLYVLLTGTTPLDRKRLKQAAVAEAMRIIREEEPPKPSTRLSESKDSLSSLAAQRRTEPARLTREVRGELDWIVMKCLEKDRTRRYETASALARDVERHLHDDPVEAGPPSTGYRLKKFARKNRKLLGTAAAFVVLLVLGVLVSAWQAVRATDAEGRAVDEATAAVAERNEKQAALERLEAEQVRTKAALAAESKARRQTHEALNTMTDEVIEELFAKQPQLGENEKAFLRKVLSFYQAFAAEKGESKGARAAATDGQFRVAQVRAFLGENAEALAGYREAVRLAEKLTADFPDVPAYRQHLASSLNGLGKLLHELGKRSEAATANQQALAIYEKLAADFPLVREYRQDLAKSLSNLGVMLSELGKRPQAAKAHGQALAIQEKLAAHFPAVPAYRHDLAASHVNRGSLLQELGKRREAATAYRQALAILEKLATDFPAVPAYRHHLAGSCYNLGNLLRELGERPEAETAYRQALAIREKLAFHFPTVPEYRQKLASNHTNLGLLLYELGKPPEAEMAHRKALAIEEKLATDFPSVPAYRTSLAGSCVNFGILLRDQGRAQDALQWYAKAIPLLETNLAQDAHPARDRLFLRNAHCNRARALTDLKRVAEAVNDWNRTIELSEGPDLPRFRNELGLCLFDLGRREEAVAEYRKAILLDPKDASVHNTLAWALYEMGRLKEAEEVYRKALALDPNSALVHNNLGRCLYYLGRGEEAVAEYRKAIALDSRFAAPHENLGDALAGEARLDEATAEYRKALELGSKPAGERLRRLPMVRRLFAVLRGDDKPASAAEQLDFANLCQQYYLRRYAAAERFFAGAFAADPKLAGDLKSFNRYDAACAAALAASGQGEDAAKLDDKEKARLRGQALVWLKADLAAHLKQLASKQPHDRDEARARLLHWRQDTDLVGVRDPAGLAKLPEAERAAWQRLWREVEGALATHVKK